MSTSSIWSAARTTASGIVSRWRTPVMRSTTSPSDSRCCTLTVEITSIPAARSSSTSSQRLAWREPGAQVCASSSTTHTSGARASTASTSSSVSAVPAVVEDRAGQHLEALEQLGGAGPSVGLDEPDDDVGAPLEAAAGLVQRGVGLADAGRRAEVDAQFTARRGDRIGGHLVILHRTPSRIPGAAGARDALSSGTFTRGSPRTPSVRPSVASATSARTRSSGEPGHPGDARAPAAPRTRG